jgi:hypothetical protein
MFMTMLKDYEIKTVEPRHRETQSSIQELKDIVTQGKGVRNLGGVILSIASFLWIIFQIANYVDAHK